MTDAEFRDAFHGHKDVVHRFAYRMTGSASAAEDVVQDCFLILWRKPAAYDPRRGAMRAFLLGIARNLVLRRWRDERPHEALEDDAFVFQPLNVREDGRAEAVEKAILMLPPLQREAVVLAEYEEMSLEEIAHATAADLAAVKSRLHRARQNLRRMLAPILESKGAFHGTK
ncbi:MAG TPA: RNA polymerase sigma factor [Bryobacteraceae bacterium]|jgi:RNA polymerase sigma-70 factor (ECF subfamily)|nr:RNA polymerase sigma factor [Bryobacteraceae bacterium]